MKRIVYLIVFLLSSFSVLAFGREGPGDDIFVIAVILALIFVAIYFMGHSKASHHEKVYGDFLGGKKTERGPGMDISGGGSSVGGREPIHDIKVIEKETVVAEDEVEESEDVVEEIIPIVEPEIEETEVAMGEYEKLLRKAQELRKDLTKKDRPDIYNDLNTVLTYFNEIKERMTKVMELAPHHKGILERLTALFTNLKKHLTNVEVYESDLEKRESLIEKEKKAKLIDQMKGANAHLRKFMEQAWAKQEGVKEDERVRLQHFSAYFKSHILKSFALAEKGIVHLEQDLAKADTLLHDWDDAEAKLLPELQEMMTAFKKGEHEEHLTGKIISDHLRKANGFFMHFRFDLRKLHESLKESDKDAKQLHANLELLEKELHQMEAEEKKIEYEVRK